MKPWKTTAAAAALAVTALGANAWARPHGGGMCGGKGVALERLERGVATLGLEQEKLDAVYQLIDQARGQRRGLDAGIRTAHERMRELLEQDAPSVEAVTAQADSIGELTTEARKVELRALVQVRTLLTPEQWQRLEKQRGERHHAGEREPSSEL